MNIITCPITFNTVGSWGVRLAGNLTISHQASSKVLNGQTGLGGDTANLKVVASTPFKSPFYTSFDFTSSISQHGLIWNTSLGLQKSLYIMSGQYFHCLLFPAAMTFLRLSDLCSTDTQPTLTGLRKAAKHILIHSSSALLRTGLSKVLAGVLSLCIWKGSPQPAGPLVRMEDASKGWGVLDSWQKQRYSVASCYVAKLAIFLWPSLLKYSACVCENVSQFALHVNALLLNYSCGINVPTCSS